jgi:hypothetical protein
VEIGTNAEIKKILTGLTGKDAKQGRLSWKIWRREYFLLKRAKCRRWKLGNYI